MEVICLQDEAFYALVENVVTRLKEQHSIKQDKWISDDEAMKRLRISSRGTLQKLRDEGKIEYSRMSKKIILYNSASIDQFIQKNTQNPF